MKWLWKLLRIRGDARALQRGPTAYGKRLGRRHAHRTLSRWLR